MQHVQPLFAKARAAAASFALLACSGGPPATENGSTAQGATPGARPGSTGDDVASDDVDTVSTGADATTGGSEPDGPVPLFPGIFPLDGLMLDLPFDDLAPLAPIVSDARIVALGESIHTAEAFLAGKARLSRYLIEEHGFRVIGLETPWYDMRALQQHLTRCKSETSDVVLGSMFPVWADSNMVDLVDWMCQWNTDNPADTVDFRGFDQQQPWHDGALVLEAMARVDPSSIDTVFGGVDRCNGVGFSDFEAYIESAEALVWSGQAPDEDAHAQCLAALPELESWVDQYATVIAAASSGDDLFWVQVAVRGIRAWENASYYTDRDDKLSFESRDFANAQTIVEVRDRFSPGQRMILWGHNFHIFKDSTALDEFAGGPTLTGTILANRLRSEFVAIGFVGYDIDINWFEPYDGAKADGARAVESFLHGIGESYLLVDLHPEGEKPFPRDEVFDLGHPDHLVLPMVPGDQFDALVFVDESPGMTPAGR